jgi:hypothetical protein
MSQETWQRCLRKAADNRKTLRFAVNDYQKRAGTKSWPLAVTPVPLPDDLNKLVSDLWPELMIKPWAGKEMF